MSEKVKVSREIFDAINKLENWIGLDKHISEKVLKISQIIAYGYEVEKSPEEKVLEHYEGLGESISAMERKLGIKGTLELLGIKIKGVND